MADELDSLRSSDEELPNRISAIEAIGYTAVIAFIGAMAAGWLDGMVPWK